MSNEYLKATLEMMQARARTETFRDGLTPEQRGEFDASVRQFMGKPELDFRTGQNGDPTWELILDVRRNWATVIRDEFSKYHDHENNRGGECGACGAIQAANFMDPDYSGDGPRS